LIYDEEDVKFKELLEFLFACCMRRDIKD